jgi:hypothetical protein
MYLSMNINPNFVHFICCLLAKGESGATKNVNFIATARGICGDKGKRCQSIWKGFVRVSQAALLPLFGETIKTPCVSVRFIIAQNLVISAENVNCQFYGNLKNSLSF